MLNLQTKVCIPNPEFNIDYSDSLCLFGSCFSDNIGKLLAKHKFNACINPFGVLYNPASIAQSIDFLFNEKEFSEEDLSFLNEQWFSYYHHSIFSSTEKFECLRNINHSFQTAKKAIVNSKVIVFTLGTAWVYQLKSSNKTVANCHKVPASEFNRVYLDTEKIIDLLSESIKSIITANPNANIVFTVSPIRHWKDGAIENMRSKSTLILAIKKLEELFPQSYYFPSFEIYMDELRDYRFYASDMLHPSELSITYIWEIFKNTFFTKETIQDNKEVEKLVKSFEHRTFNANTELYAKFKARLIRLSENLEQRIPSISFLDERNALL